MRTEILMPALSPAMTDGRIAKWHVREGQTVAAGDVIAEIADASATMEIEAADAGRVERILVPAGTAGVKVNTPIAVIRAERTAARLESVAVGVTALSGPDVPAPPRRNGAAKRPAQPGETPQRSATGDCQILTYREALRDALAEEMRRDADVFLMGVDVAQNRGAPKVSQGLIDEFGPARVITTPPLEEAFTGLAVGAAFAGLKPVVEFQSWAIAFQAMHQILGVAAETYHVLGGEIAVPIVLRGPNGWAPGVPGQMSRCFASLFAHVPGLKVVAPASPADAKGLLKAAIRDPAPVIVLESELLYAASGPVPLAADWLVPIGTAHIARPGRHLSIVAYGRAVGTALMAAHDLARDGIDAEVVDLRSLRPLDLETVLSSVARTRRLLTVEEGWPMCSLGSEVCASVAIGAFRILAAPPVRVAGADVPMPYAASLEAAALPDPERVVGAAKSLLSAA
ncbi:MAG TPA: pyruvate dehydrogenase complex E1 component subunit beta [Hyphomicrobiaceae bacterium]|nr:pyruvate dehydrogenase complex E1 component subunit beta [Hyphomicrobiaceae bacterium]